MLGVKTMCVIVDRYPGVSPISRKQSNAKEAYVTLQHSIRRLRRNSPEHMDVSWFAESLGLTQWDDRPCRRYFAGRTILSTKIIAPAHNLP